MEAAIKTVNKALDHSFAQAFLVFAGIFTVSVSLVDNPQNQVHLIKLALFTLFYAVVIHAITAIKRHETLGRHAVGNNLGRVVLFTAISLLYTAAWVTGSWGILLNEKLSPLSLILLVTGIILTTIWFFIIFYYFWKDKESCIKSSRKDKSTYEFLYRCKNCDSHGTVWVEKGKPHHDHTCPNCCLYELEKQGENTNKAINKEPYKKDCEEKQDYKLERNHITCVLGLLAFIVPMVVLNSPMYLQEIFYLRELATGFSAGLLGLIIRNFIFLSSGIKEKSGKDIRLAYLAYSVFVLFTSLLIFSFLKINLSVTGLEFSLLLLSFNFYSGVITYGVLDFIKEALNRLKQ